MNRSLRCCAWRCQRRAPSHSKRCRTALPRPSPSTACCLMVVFSNGGTRCLTWRLCARETAGKRVKPTGRAAARYVERETRDANMYMHKRGELNTSHARARGFADSETFAPALSPTLTLSSCWQFHLPDKEAGLAYVPSGLRACGPASTSASLPPSGW